MVNGFMGIAYSSNEIRDGRFVDRTLESDFMQARYDMLRQPNKTAFNESAWRRNTVEARQEFLRMMEEVDRRNTADFERPDEGRGGDMESDNFTYTGSEQPPRDVKTIIVGSDVKEIEDGAFKDLSQLRSVVFPDEAVDLKIGKGAFKNCTALTAIRLNGATFVGDDAFLNCTGLVAAELGSSCQHIGMGAFKNCSSLAAISIPPNVTFMGDYAFANCAGLKTAMLLDGVVEVPAYCFQNDTSLEQVILPISIEKVGKNAFQNCPSVEVYVPTTNMGEAEELLGVKMVAKAEDDDTILKCDQDYIVRLYKDLY